MYRIILTILFIVTECLGCAFISGCGNDSELNVFRDRSSDYKKAKIYPPIEIPKGVRAESFTDTYLIP